jgi:hypothetical protein
VSISRISVVECNQVQSSTGVNCIRETAVAIVGPKSSHDIAKANEEREGSHSEHSIA